MRKVDRVVVVVFDGLRPDMVDDIRTPHLMRFARRGTWFRNARSVFPSMTRVATASIATGALPRTHGIVGNAFYFPKAIPEHVLDVSRLDDILRAEAATGGLFLTAPTFADVLAREGRRLAIVHAGSAGSAYLLNPRAVENRHWTFSVHGAGAVRTPLAVHDVVERLGALPPRELPRFAEIDYCARVMTEIVLPDRTNDVALVWFNEPDTSYHYKMLGAPETAAVLTHVDAAFGSILDWIERQADRDRYAVLVASDHGQISSDRFVDVADLLGRQGHATRPVSARQLDGAVVTFTGGNMGEIRILEGGTARRDAIARWLGEQPFVSALFSPGVNDVEGAAPGSLSHATVGLDHPRQPDLVYVLSSSHAPDPFGLPGRCAISGGEIPTGGGMHGGLNRYELNTVLMLAAPGIPGDRMDTRGCGIVDIAPTILDLIGVRRATTMTGVSVAAPAMEMPLHRHEVARGVASSGVLTRRLGDRLLIEHGLFEHGP